MSRKTIAVSGIITTVLLLSLLFIVVSRRGQDRVKEHITQDSTPEKKQEAAASGNNNAGTDINETLKVKRNVTSEIEADQLEEIIKELTREMLKETEMRAEEIFDSAIQNKVYFIQDQVIKNNPRFSDVRKELRNELESEFKIANKSTHELVKKAMELRSEYWQAGGDFSPESYVAAYKARVLLEICHEREPDNLAIMDELVETIQITTVNAFYEDNLKTRIPNTRWTDEILNLRLKQYKIIEKEVASGRPPKFEDFVCASDLVCMTARTNREMAMNVIDFLIKHAERGGWQPYAKRFVSRARDKWIDNEEYNVWWPVYDQLFDDDTFKGYRYSRHLPSYRGSRELPLFYPWGNDITELPSYVRTE